MAGTRRKGLAQRLEQAGSQMKPGRVARDRAGTAPSSASSSAPWSSTSWSVWSAVLFGFVINHFLLKRRVGKRQSRVRLAAAPRPCSSSPVVSGPVRACPRRSPTWPTTRRRPPAEEYRRVLTETRLGRDLTEALYAVAERMDSEDFEWVVGAIDINRTTGGDLSVILDRVTETIRQRDRLRGQVRTLSAEGRLSGWVVGLLPPGVFGFVYTDQPRVHGGLLLRAPWVTLLLGGAALLLLVGALWLRKIAKPVF